MVAQLTRDAADGASLVVGVTKLAWMYGRSRDWAERLFRGWEEEQRAGTAPVRVFKHGKRGSLYTTLSVIHQHMPPGRDPVLYRRMADVEADVKNAHERIDREISERKKADAELERQVAGVRRR